MPPQPIADRVASRFLWQIRCRIDERDTVMPGAEHACRVVAPVRCQYDFCAAELEQPFETIQQHRVDNKWKLAGVWRPLAVEDAIDIQKDDFHPAGRRSHTGIEL